jgi:hypothetical protein
MRRRIMAGALAAGLCLGLAPAGAASLPAPNIAGAKKLISPDEILKPLDFPVVGRQRVSGTINGYQHPAYLVPVAKGQTLTVTLTSASDNACFNIHDAADQSGMAVFNGNSGERTARLTATAAMSYVIRPFQPRASARRKERIPFRLTVERR